MQRNFILTDVMKTGNHLELIDFISMSNLPNQTFDTSGDYYTLHNFDLDSYDRRFAVIDVAYWNKPYNSHEFNDELKRRCDLLHSQGFHIIKASTWESSDNVKKSTNYYPKIELPHVKWLGGVSYFWFHMYRKYLRQSLNFDHTKKKFQFLYLNKTSRPHREKLFYAMSRENMLDDCLFTFHDKGITMPKEYELPEIGAKKYPRMGKDQEIYPLPYEHTKYSLISETNDTNDEIFMTEKIWKPILAQHIFVVHGNYLYLQKLREMGFKTFSNYFDESYDLQLDKNKRIDKIIDTCKYLTQANWKDLYLQTQALRKHNFDNFFNKNKLCEQINITLKLFLEFADSR